MPGNDVGDRIHNFFGQENLSQGQQQSQVVDRTWHAPSNNPWAGNQRQIGAPLVPNLKSSNVQQSADSESGHGGPSSNAQHSVNFSQANLRPEFLRNQSQGQQPILNGYMHGHQVFQTRQNEANFLGVGTESDCHNLTSRGFAVSSVLDSQLRNGPELHRKNSVGMDFTESPVNYDFFASQQQMSSQHPGMMQSLARQQSGITDMQVLQQQLILKQMQEMQMQRQQQLQKQQEARHLNAVNQISSFPKQAVGGQSMAMINGIPIHDASNYSWQSELMAANANWPQRSASPFMHGSSGGLILSPDHSQVPRLMGMVPQQVDQSLQGVPISGTRVASSQYSPIQVEQPAIHQVSGSGTSFQGNQYTGPTDQINVHDGILNSRQGYQGKNLIGTVDGQAFNGGFNLENRQQVNQQQKDTSGHEYHHRQDVGSPSDKSQDKTVLQVAPSQNVATLDPTEEKILFGSDDNLWEAFGKSANLGSGANNVLDGTDVFGIPSVSGSWSALMQSAVAETSSGDIGPQEGWSGLTFHSKEPSVASPQMPAINESKKQSTWANNTPSAGAGANFNSIPIVRQSGVDTLHQHNERLSTDSSQRFPHFPGEGTKGLDCSLPQNLVTEGNHIFGKLSHSSNVDSNTKPISNPWNNQQSIPSYNTGGQESSRSNGWNFIDSASPSMHSAMEIQGNEKTVQASQCTDQKGPAFEATGFAASRLKTDPFRNSAVRMDQAKSDIESSLFNAEDSNLNNVSVYQNLGTAQANLGDSQQLKSNNIDIWKHVDSSENPKGSDIMGKHQSITNKHHQALETSRSSSFRNGTIETREFQNSNTNRSTTNSFQDISHDATSVGVKENSWLDASDSHTLPGGKPKSSNHVAQKPLAIRKFHYHPMGDLEVAPEPSYATKNISPSQSTQQQVSQGHDHGHTAQSKLPSQHDRGSMEIEKDHFPGFHGDAKPLGALPSKGMPSPMTSTSHERALNNFPPNKIIPSSQNMLELFHKVDQSRDHRNATHHDFSNRNQPSEKSEALIFDGSVRVQQNQSSGSQGFGLQLAPPAQTFPVQEHTFSSQSHLHKSNSMSSSHVASGEKGHKWLAGTSRETSQGETRKTSQGETRNDSSGTSGQTGTNAHGKFPPAFSSDYPYSRSHLQNKLMSETGRPTAEQSVDSSFDSFSSPSKRMNGSFERAETSHSAVASVHGTSRKTGHDNIAMTGEMSQPSGVNQNIGDSAQQFPILEAAQVPQHYTISGMSQDGDSSKKSPAVWTSVSDRQHSFGARQFKAPSSLTKSTLYSNNSAETTLSPPEKIDGKIAEMVGNGPSDAGGPVNPHGLAGKEQLKKGGPQPQVLPEQDRSQTTMSTSQEQEHFTGTSLSKSSSSQREIEAFGRTLRPNNSTPNYSLLHQMQSLRNTDVDPGNRSSKRLKSPDGSVDAQLVISQGGQQLYGHNNIVREPQIDQTSTLSGDPRLLNFSVKPTVDHDAKAPSQDVYAFGGRSDPQGANLTSLGGDHSQISPQMAPSWFDRYGTFKNGQVLPQYDVRKATIMKTAELPLAVGRPSDGLHPHGLMEQRSAPAADTGHNHIVQKTLATSLLGSENASPQLMRPDPASTNLLVVQQKKRKSATSELSAWHREVKHGPRKLQTISTAEVDWARVANRLPEKVEDEAEIVEDGPPLLRSKRRLILTTQLLQLLLCPPPASVLSADCISHHESVIRFVARSTLGDACSALSFTGSDIPVPSDGGKILPEKHKTSEKISDQFFSKVMEDLINRAKKVENDLSRLDKRASVLDLRVECQDLEKFSVINRFAKFHGRAQADGAEASSSDANALRLVPQRYVTALPMPKNLPDRPVRVVRREMGLLTNGRANSMLGI